MGVEYFSPSARVEIYPREGTETIRNHNFQK